MYSSTHLYTHNCAPDFKPVPRAVCTQACVCTRICTLGRSRAGRGVEMDRFIHRRVSAGWRGIANGDKVELKHAPAPYVISVGCVCADSFTQQ
jgi:hypothetical protein